MPARNCIFVDLHCSLSLIFILDFNEKVCVITVFLMGLCLFYLEHFRMFSVFSEIAGLVSVCQFFTAMAKYLN